jgi:hypothetical protein
MAYAERTKVSVEETILDIRRTVSRYGGEQFMFAVAEEKIIVGFTKDARQVRFQVAQDTKDAQSNKQRARALLLVLKAKLEAVQSGVAIFEDEFLANIVLPNGSLVGQELRPKLAYAYESREMPALLPDYSQ